MPSKAQRESSQDTASEPLMTRTQLAAFLGVTLKTTYRYRIPCIRLSLRCTRFDPVTVRRWVAARAALED